MGGTVVPGGRQVVQFFGVAHGPKTLYIVFELMSRGSLYVKSKPLLVVL